MKILLIISLVLTIGIGYLIFLNINKKEAGTIIILNGPSGSGKSSIQKEFQKLQMPNLWIKAGIDNLFDNVMPDITPENMSFWQSKNSIRWIEKTSDSSNKDVITLFVGPEGEKVAYAMNDCIASYANSGCNVIVDYIAYKQEWLKDLEQKTKKFKTYYVAVEIPLDTLEQREADRGTSPVGHARSHYSNIYGNRTYDLVVDSGQSSAKDIALQIKQLID